MTVGRHTEVTSSSKTSLDDALETGINRATTKLKNLSRDWVPSPEATTGAGKVKEYRVRIEVTFILND